MIYQQQALRFECTGCGKCCTGNNDHYIAMNKVEAERIRKYLDISESWFRRRYVSHLTRNTLTARMKDGRCSFLDPQGSCRIYHLRPVQCQTYPWWPEVVETKRSWNNEAKRCEGINAGSVVPVKNITHQLTRQLKSEQAE